MRKFIMFLVIGVVPGICMADADRLFYDYIRAVKQLTAVNGDEAFADEQKWNADFRGKVTRLCHDISDYVSKNNLAVSINSQNTSFIKSGQEYDCFRTDCGADMLTNYVNFGCVLLLKTIPVSENNMENLQVQSSEKEPDIDKSDEKNTSVQSSNDMDVQNAVRASFIMDVQQNSFYQNVAMGAGGWKTEPEVNCEIDMDNRWKCVFSVTFNNGVTYGTCGHKIFLGNNGGSYRFSGGPQTMRKATGKTIPYGVDDFDDACH